MHFDGALLDLQCPRDDLVGLASFEQVEDTKLAARETVRVGWPDCGSPRSLAIPNEIDQHIEWDERPALVHEAQGFEQNLRVEAGWDIRAGAQKQSLKHGGAVFPIRDHDDRHARERLSQAGEGRFDAVVAAGVLTSIYDGDIDLGVWLGQTEGILEVLYRHGADAKSAQFQEAGEALPP
jgi:hypothetical protein